MDSDTTLEDSGAVIVEDSPWKRGRKQGWEKAIRTWGEDLRSIFAPFFLWKVSKPNAHWAAESFFFRYAPNTDNCAASKRLTPIAIPPELLRGQSLPSAYTLQLSKGI